VIRWTNWCTDEWMWMDCADSRLNRGAGAWLDKFIDVLNVVSNALLD
jgi:hypothetical protein